MWLLKTEPDEYSYQDLERAGRTRGDGVRNPVALRNLRLMKEGDRVFVDHTGGEKRVMGEAEVVRAAYADPATHNSKLVVVDLEPRGALPRPVPLAELRTLAELADSPLLRQGRLSVVPLTAAQWEAIAERGAR